MARAQTMLEQLLGEVSPGAERADVLFELAHIAVGNPPALASLYERAWADVEQDDARFARWLAFRAWARLLESDNVRALADARAALARAERVGDPELVAAVIARLGQIEMWAGEVTPGLLERGAALALSEGLSPDYWTNPRFWLARLRIRQGRLEEARAMFAVLEDETVARGDEQTHTHVLWYRSILEWFAGNWQLALELASEACGLGEQMRFANNGGWKGRVKALIEADLGLVSQARASAGEGLAEMQGSQNEVFCLLCLGVLGRLELALGNVQEAGRYLSELPARLISSGLNDPTQTIWADAIETLVALGEVEQGRVYLDTYEQNSRRVESGWAVACAARCRGQLAAAQGDVAAAVESLRRPSSNWTGRRMCSSGGARCSAWAWFAVRLCRRRRHARRWGRHLRSSRSSARGCGRRRRARSWRGSVAGGQKGMSSQRPRRAWRSWRPPGGPTRRSPPSCSWA